MSTSSEHVRASGPLDSHCLDRLVGGELPEDERRALLLRLDTEPDGWRRCALAFLEAQMWREALAPLGTAASADRPMPASVAPASRRTSWRRVVRWSALAACIAVVFGLGWEAKPVPSPAALPEQTRVVAHAAPSSADAPETSVIVAPVERTKPAERSDVNELLDSMVASYERRGYAPERQKKLITVKLEDGRERQVQAEEVRLRFVGDRTY